MDYNVGDKVFLRVSPWKVVLRFGKKGKLSPRYIGPYEIVARIGPILIDWLYLKNCRNFMMFFM